MDQVRVRYAPSPTGQLHIGNARSALFNLLFARHYQGKFIIRIEDTDTKRNVKDGEKSQLDNLAWLGIVADESPLTPGQYGPYRQLERLDIYQKYANELLQKGLAYKDYLENSDKYAIRFKVPSNITYTFNDMVRGPLKFESKEVEDWVILKENGIPTYNFAVVIDDYLMKITHVLRGEEHITNTPKQIMIYQAFNWTPPLFGHMTIIVNEKKKKLSKRDTNVLQFISDYKDLGYLPEAMFNFISLLGWSPRSSEEILSSNELINLFDSQQLSKSPAMFDQEKLAFINAQYIKKLDPLALIDLCQPFLQQAGIKIINQEWLINLLTLFQDRLVYGAQIVEFYQKFFSQFTLSEELLNTLKELPALIVLKVLIEKLENINFNLDSINEAIKNVSQQTNIKGKELFMSIRISTTAESHGPSLPHSLLLLGQTEVIKRLKQALNALKGVKL